jgi:hypothetical protein
MNALKRIAIHCGFGMVVENTREEVTREDADAANFPFVTPSHVTTITQNLTVQANAIPIASRFWARKLAKPGFYWEEDNHLPLLQSNGACPECVGLRPDKSQHVARLARLLKERFANAHVSELFASMARLAEEKQVIEPELLEELGVSVNIIVDTFVELVFASEFWLCRKPAAAATVEDSPDVRDEGGAQETIQLDLGSDTYTHACPNCDTILSRSEIMKNAPQCPNCHAKLKVNKHE